MSIGCGVGDTELLLAPHVSHITRIDLSPPRFNTPGELPARSSNFELIADRSALDGG